MINFRKHSGFIQLNRITERWDMSTEIVTWQLLSSTHLGRHMHSSGVHATDEVLLSVMPSFSCNRKWS